MERQRVLNLGFVTEHEKLRRNTNAFWGPEMAPFTYTSSCWGVDSSREGSPDSNIGSSYQPAPTMDSSASGPRSRFGRKKVLSPISPTPSPPLLPTHRQPVHPYGGVIGAGRQAGKRSAQKGVLIPLQGSHSLLPGSSRDPLLSPERVRSPTPLEYIEDDEPMKEGVTVVYFSHFSDIFQHSLFTFSLIFRYVLCLFPSISLAFYGHLFYLIPAILIYCSNPILLSFPFNSSKFSHHTLGNETSY